MEYSYMTYIGIIVFVLLFMLAIIGSRKRKIKYQYEKTRILTFAESNFYKVLQKSCQDSGHIVCPKVRIADIITPAKKLNTKTYSRLFWKISSKHIDFVIMDKNTYQPLLCIELNDRSHNRKKRQERDLFVSSALESAELPILWVQAGKTYCHVTLAKKMEEIIKDKQKSNTPSTLLKF